MMKRLPRGSLRDYERQGGRRDRLDEMLNIGELLWAPLIPDEPKTLTGSGQNGKQTGCFSFNMKHTDKWTAGVKAGANSFVSLEPNIVNPTLRPGFGAGAFARGTVEVADKAFDSP